jgi:hypothetical protein
MCQAASADVDQLGEHQICVLFHGRPRRRSFETL